MDVHSTRSSRLTRLGSQVVTRAWSGGRSSARQSLSSRARCVAFELAASRLVPALHERACFWGPSPPADPRTPGGIVAEVASGLPLPGRGCRSGPRRPVGREEGRDCRVRAAPFQATITRFRFRPRWLRRHASLHMWPQTAWPAGPEQDNRVPALGRGSRGPSTVWWCPVGTWAPLHGVPASTIPSKGRETATFARRGAAGCSQRTPERKPGQGPRPFRGQRRGGGLRRRSLGTVGLGRPPQSAQSVGR